MTSTSQERWLRVGAMLMAPAACGSLGLGRPYLELDCSDDPTDTTNAQCLINDQFGCARSFRGLPSRHVPRAFITLFSFPPSARGWEANREINSRDHACRSEFLPPRSYPQHPFTTTTTRGFIPVHIPPWTVSCVDRLHPPLTPAPQPLPGDVLHLVDTFQAYITHHPRPF